MPPMALRLDDGSIQPACRKSFHRLFFLQPIIPYRTVIDIGSFPAATASLNQPGCRPRPDQVMRGSAVLIASAVVRDLGGQVTQDFRPDRLSMSLGFPLADAAEKSDAG